MGEKYTSVFLKVFVGVYKREDSKELSIHGEMRITDSYCFLNTNLDKLVFFLPGGFHYSRQPFFSEPHYRRNKAETHTREQAKFTILTGGRAVSTQ